ncbi:hypothetical protein G6F36_013870 [Rhizopus arrhizus]|nr:hypothetical protein G6F36_013870 [Rhizopus arrhizus]
MLNSKELTEANVYVSPHHYLEWFHVIQKEMNKKQHIQENVPQKAATPDYVHRNLKSIEGVSNLNAKGYQSSKEAALVSINLSKSLGVSKRFEKLHIDLEKVKMFVKNTQEIQDNKFNPRK